MQLRPNDLAEIKRIVGSAAPSALKSSFHTVKCVRDIAYIVEQYGLGINDALDCAKRLVRLSPAEVEDHLAVEQRSITTLMRFAQPEALADGRLQLHLPNERPLEKFAPRSKWSPKDAAEIKSLMTSFYESAFGLWMAGESAARADLDQGFAQEIAAEYRNLWVQEDLLLIFAKDSYLDMLEAAAITAPTGQLNDDELLAPSGVIIFENERIMPSLTAEDDLVPIRGITWRAEDGHLTVQVMIDGHHELVNPGRVEPPADCYAYLYQLNLFKGPMRNPTALGHEEGVNALLGYLRSIKVIAQSPATESTTAQPKARSKARSKKNKRSQKAAARPTEVRVLSLRNAEHGRYELDAATGRKVRQHWVRGHWRNQWYPSLEDNRSIWIDGYIKGDASLGTVTGQKVHVGR